MATLPTISVIMSVFNGELYLLEAIESIISQTFEDFQFIIINDGSTDNSLEIIKEYESKDSRIMAITQKNIGLTKSLNIAISLAKGKYIARMDADDISLPHRFETQLPWLENKGFDLCCSRTWLMEENRVSPRLKYYLPKKWLLKFCNPFIHGTYMMQQSALRKIGGYNESFQYAQDYRLINDFFQKGYRVRYLKEHLYLTRKHKESISIKFKDKQNQFVKYFKNK